MSEADNAPQGQSEGPADREHRWRTRLLPFMVRFLVVFAAFFLIASLVQLVYLQSHIRNAPQSRFDETYALLTPPGDVKPGERLEFVRARIALDLELHALQRRYHQANAQLMARVWMRYLGFLTGMTLALVGAAFILGQLPGPRSSLQGKTGSMEISVKSASPGILLATLGVILMVTTIVTRHLVDVKDAAVYLQRWGTEVERPAERGSAADQDDNQQAPQQPLLGPAPRPENGGQNE